MVNSKSKLKSGVSTRPRVPSASDVEAKIYITAPRLREMLGISAVTLWRWRHNEKAEFPTPIRINDRLYFPRAQVLAWIDRQPRAA